MVDDAPSCGSRHWPSEGRLAGSTPAWGTVGCLAAPSAGSTKPGWQVRLLPAPRTDSGVAQAVEHLPEEEGAAGSTPAAGTGSRAPRSQRTNSLIGFSTTPLMWRSRFKSGNPVAAA